MKPKVLLTKIFRNEAFASAHRRAGLAKLAEIADLVDYDSDLTGDMADGVVGVIANSSLVHREFYEGAADLRVIARWGVGYDKVQIEAATELGVPVTITPVHMDAVAEYTIAQWMAALKRTHTLNRMSHAGDFTIIPTLEARGSTLGLYGFGRIGQEVALRARPCWATRAACWSTTSVPTSPRSPPATAPRPWTIPCASSRRATP